jgi:thiol-disulfide isomerase/thioredoxin
MIAPYFEELANKNKNITFIKVDVDEAEDIAADCNISGIRSNVTIKHSI